MKTSLSARIQITGHAKAENLKELLEKIPDNASVRVNTIQSDRPYLSDENYLEFTWTEER